MLWALMADGLDGSLSFVSTPPSHVSQVTHHNAGLFRALQKCGRTRLFVGSLVANCRPWSFGFGYPLRVCRSLRRHYITRIKFLHPRARNASGAQPAAKFGPDKKLTVT